MSTAEAPASPSNSLVPSPVDTGFGLSSASQFAHVQRVAQMFSQSQLIPVAFQKNIPNTVIALEMAERMGCGVMAVMQNLNVIHGRPSFSSAFCTASVNTCGRFTPLQFKYEGAVGTMQRSCRAFAKLKSSGEICEGALVTMQMAQDEGWLGKTGSKWKTMPELMLSYRASTFFTRMYAPELLMGMKTEDEIIDIQPSGEPFIEKIALTNGATTNNTESKPADGPETTGTTTTTRRGRGGVNAMKKAGAPEVIVPAETPAAPVEQPQAPAAEEPAKTPEASAQQPSFELQDEPATEEQKKEEAPAQAAAAVVPKKRCEVVSITPRKTTTGPALEVVLKGDLDGKAYFIGTAEKFPASVGVVGDFTIEAKDAGNGNTIHFINAVEVLA